MVFLTKRQYTALMSSISSTTVVPLELGRIYAENQCFLPDHGKDLVNLFFHWIVIFWLQTSLVQKTACGRSFWGKETLAVASGLLPVVRLLMQLAHHLMDLLHQLAHLIPLRTIILVLAGQSCRRSSQTGSQAS